ncbi:MAG: peptidase [Oscillospiraceae bacterium]|nr:peptidase [Oscillospiraceae bacterium]
MRNLQLAHRGVEIITHNWMQVRSGESVLIVTDEDHAQEMELLKRYMEDIGATVQLEMMPKSDTKFSGLLDAADGGLEEYDVIIGATHYSIVTKPAVRLAVKEGSRFLSLPMSTNDNRSILEYDFLTMDTGKSRFVAKELLKFIRQSDYLRVTTKLGTDLYFRKIDREANYFNGMAKDGKGFASSSFEVYVPIEEDQTQGVAILDGSYGYLGKVDRPFEIGFDGGRIVKIEQSESGKKLSKYLEAFNDPRMYYAAEFGIGTNFFSHCEGNCYIEDESSYGTFHVGFGRNIALGGEFEADGHFDLVFLKPTIYADNRMIMEDGIIIPAVPEAW